MRERIRLSDLSVLYICPSKKWGTLERRCLQDSLFIRDIGGNPIIYCTKDSHLDREAELQDIPRFYYSGTEVKSFIDWNYFNDIKTFFKNNTFDIVHCYSLRYVWSVCLLMMRNPLVPLILTFNRFISNSKFGFIKRWLLKRVDLVITFSRSVSDIVEEKLPIPKRKIKVFGAGIEMSHLESHREEGERIIGSFIPRNVDSFQNVISILYAMKPLKRATENLATDVKFVLYCENTGHDDEKILMLQNKITELELTEDVELKFVDLHKKEVEKLDVLIGVDFDEPFNDIEIRALLANIPIVAPRTASRQNLLSRHRWMGETYKRGDAREIKDKVLKILINEQVYLSEIEARQEVFRSVHGVEYYTEQIGSHYERLCLGRRRLYQRKK